LKNKYKDDDDAGIEKGKGKKGIFLKQI